MKGLTYTGNFHCCGKITTHRDNNTPLMLKYLIHKKQKKAFSFFNLSYEIINVFPIGSKQ